MFVAIYLCLCSSLFVVDNVNVLEIFPWLYKEDDVRVIDGYDYLQAHVFKFGLAESSLCPLCKSGPMTGEHTSYCPALLHVLSLDNCGVSLLA
ncbi:hypothetical protein TNCV_394481 [Trichonephila clavipes]|nr:hypothetical protein TNCV_394481 [Trichonephila clavipes]